MMTVADVMLEVNKGFSIGMLDEDACREWFLKKIHAEGVRCPRCNKEITSKRKLDTFWAMRRVNCPFCSRSFSAVTGTPLNGIGIEFRSLYLLLFMVSHGIRVNRIADQLRISTGAAYLWANKAKCVDSAQYEKPPEP
ncbi:MULTISPECIES: hypothetical protein [Geobacter]|uniref:hypothetical protein n=1 Tax=Geobacter TaxID=28231 RepID=UPI002572A86B|nr:hypothetical protein [Geobacter sulfurreducens]BET58115.1 hypothetical protein GEO60473_11550 [Geobacter sp. 60473]